MRRLAALVSLPLLACSGGEGAPPPSSAPVPPTTTATRPPAPAATLASADPFGCALAVVEDGRVLWPSRDEAVIAVADAGEGAPSWIAMPESVVSHAPEASEAIVITADGVCTATLGPPELHTVFEYDTPDVGRALSGCSTTDVGFALICPEGASVPTNLHFSPFVRSEVSIVDDATTDRALARAYRARDEYGERWLADCEREGRTEVVRGRSAEVSVGSEHLVFTELARAWFTAGTDPATGCPETETLHAAVWSDERVADGHDFGGVIHDGTHVQALLEVGADSEPRNCEGASTCVFVGLDTPTRYFPGRFVRRSRAVAHLGSGELSYEPEVMLRNHREGCEED